jgi:uncharacterized damage-inducible protein DinB
MTRRIRVLLHLIDEAYDRKAWHGPNLRGSIRGLSESDAAWRPNRSRHSIREIVVHAAYWKYAVRRMLLGEKRGSFPLRGSNWFARPDRTGGRSWKDDVALLESEHRKMRSAIVALNDADLKKKPPKSKMTTLRIVAGIAAHDIYHAGQIQLLKRLREAR